MSETLSNIVRSSDRVAITAALHVEVIADFVCPFCFIGKRHLDEALKAVQGPYEVSSFDIYLTKRFGSPANVEPVLEHLTEEGKASGIQFRFDRIRHVPNTLPVHQLMQHAATAGADQSAMADHLMSAFFEDGSNIGERGILVDIAKAHGISPQETQEAIGSDRIRQIVATREAQVRSSGLASAPGFLINQRLLVVGAQPIDNMINAFDRAMFGEGSDSLASPALH
jgi:predicted DsbA family dithiol-disulfide isomerase